MQINQGWLDCARRVQCDHFDPRPNPHDINLLVIHNISLPPGQFGSDHVEQFFAGLLKADAHPFFAQICQMRVSSHLFIRRNGEIVQFIPFSERAWHAGISSFQGRTRCNDFSIGIELEGTDNVSYSDQQYASLSEVTKTIMHAYPKISVGRIVGHVDIAPQRKTDPGVVFDWQRYRQNISVR